MTTGVPLPAYADTVIVGAGSAGCVLADKLTRGGSRSVVLIEQGAGWPPAAVTDLCALPIGAGSQWASTYPERTAQTVVRGRGLGGSSAVNGGYFMRWHVGDFEDWATQWSFEVIERYYRELDDPDGTMSVHPYDDDELGEMASAFEQFWSSRVAVRPHGARWPVVGLNRVLTNSADGMRRTSAQAYLNPAQDRRNLLIHTESRVREVNVQGNRVTGVALADTAGSRIGCDEVILCAGTLGTAGILLRSAPGILRSAGQLRIEEHREVLVGCRLRRDAELVPLLQSVLHTAEGIEIRCYSNSFERYIDGTTSGRAVVGVAAMRPASSGTIGATDNELAIRLGEVTSPTGAALRAAANDVVDMLNSAEFAGVVVPGSASIDPVLRTSQHAWGTLPMGVRTDWAGAVADVTGLRIVDGSILPTPGRSGPHATIMMMAARIGDALE